MKKLKRIELFLPENHPIWNYPKGMRRNRAVELINTGLQIESHLKRVEQKLDSLGNKLENEKPLKSVDKDDHDTVQKVTVDIDAFTSL